MTPPAPHSSLDSPVRLAALRDTALLDTPPEEAFDRLTRLAARWLAAPVALVSLVDAERQFFKSSVGLPEPWASRRESPLSHSFCQHVVTSGEPLIVEDARVHPLVRNNVTIRELGVIAYLGFPLVVAPGLSLGSLCVIDTKPRTWTADEIQVLGDLAAAATSEIVLRSEVAERKRVEAELRESEARYERISANVPGLVYHLVIRPDGTAAFPFHNDGLREIFGANLDAARYDGNALLDMIHPDDRPSYNRTAAESSSTLTPWHWQGRIVGVSGRVHWIQVASRPQRMPDGSIVRDGLLLDITEHHRIEEERSAALTALRASEDRFRSAFDNASIGMALTTIDGRWEQVNPALCRILGYSKAELLGRSFQEISYPDEIPESLGSLRRLLAGELVTYHLEKRYRHKGGHPVWVLIDVSLIRAADGSPRNLIVQVQDISRRISAEDQLREANVTLSTLVSAAPLAIITLEADEPFTVRSWNPAAERLFGWRSDEVLGRPYALVPDSKSAEFSRLKTMLLREGKVYGVETRRQRRDGSDVDVYLLGTVVPAGAGELQQAVFFFVDISEQKQAEASVHAANDMLQSLFDLAPQAILAVDLAWNVTRWNRAAERLFGWTAEEVLGGPLPFRPDDQLDEVLARQSAEGQATDIGGIEAQRRRKDGSLVNVLLSTGVLRDAGGQAIGYIIVVSDLTQHKALEAQLRQAQKMEAVGQLAGGIAHDFNNLLTAVKVHAELLLEGLEPGSPQHTDVGEINKAATRAASLTRQLLAFSRKQLLKPQVLDLNATVDTIVPMIRRLIGEDIEVVTHLAPGVGPVTADPVQLEQVLVNLAVNARDAMPHGGVLVVETANVELDPTDPDRHRPSLGGDPYVMLTVTDSGCGMDAATLARVFDPFFTTKEPGKGTGLGLSTAYGIVTQSGGYIRVSSVPGTGTTFTIYLPRTAAAVASPVSQAAPDVPVGSETVLIIEDEQAVRGLARRVLERQGYTVLEAQHGGDALRLVATYDGPIDLVLTDLVMPGVTGRALVEQLARGRPRFKVLFMSGYTDDEIMRRGLLEHGVEFLEKPFTVDALARTVREVLDGADRGRWPGEG
jgi:PAS domain S-box-containing protein